MQLSPAADSLLGCVSLFMVHLDGCLTIHTEKKCSYYLKDFHFLYFFISTAFPPLAVPPETLGPRVRTYMHI